MIHFLSTNISWGWVWFVFWMIVSFSPATKSFNIFIGFRRAAWVGVAGFIITHYIKF